MDPATRGNAWALVITTTERRDGREVQVIALARQWVGSSVTPLSPRKVLSEIAPILRGYGLRSVLTDQWSADALRDIGHDFGLGVYPETVTGADNVAAFHDLRTLIADHRLRAPTRSRGARRPPERTPSRDAVRCGNRLAADERRAPCRLRSRDRSSHEPLRCCTGSAARRAPRPRFGRALRPT